jgi:hypothetical protein
MRQRASPPWTLPGSLPPSSSLPSPSRVSLHVSPRHVCITACITAEYHPGSPEFVQPHGLPKRKNKPKVSDPWWRATVKDCPVDRPFCASGPIASGHRLLRGPAWAACCCCPCPACCAAPRSVSAWPGWRGRQIGASRRSQSPHPPAASIPPPGPRGGQALCRPKLAAGCMTRPGLRPAPAPPRTPSAPVPNPTLLQRCWASSTSSGQRRATPPCSCSPLHYITLHYI